MLYLSADHGGFKYKEQLKEYLDKEGIAYEDLGNTVLDPEDDYPDFAIRVARQVVTSPDNKGVLLCRSGVGMTIAADKYTGIRTVLGFDVEQVKRARKDEDVNILSIASDYTSFDEVVRRVQAFIETPFSGETRHKRRMKKLAAIK